MQTSTNKKHSIKKHK